jgi:hypothetical protein
LPECEELEVTGCPAPNIQNGQVDPNKDIAIGDPVFVMCNEGYEIRGPDELECGLDGSYEELPLCVKELTQCPVPEIPNALVSPAYPIFEGTTLVIL